MIVRLQITPSYALRSNLNSSSADLFMRTLNVYYLVFSFIFICFKKAKIQQPCHFKFQVCKSHTYLYLHSTGISELL